MQIYLPDLVIIALVFVIFIIGLFILIYVRDLQNRTKKTEQMLAHQAAILSKMQGTFHARAATDAIASNAEIIYQDLLQHITPVAKALEAPKRSTSEHELWRTLGGIVDEYDKNPYVLEQLRRLIKLDQNIMRSVDSFLARSEHLLRHLVSADADGLLAATFADGLLGQTMTLLNQAKQLAQNN